MVECRRKRLGGMQNFVGATENLHPQTFGRRVTDLVKGTIFTHYLRSRNPNLGVISAL
jgi:hypothetical protein